ncbi:MAG: hypothetical protein ACHQD7_14340, partial [Chitinophagales bacterium]
KEVFDAFLLLHYCQQMGNDSNGKILYQDFQSGLEQDVVLDSLSPKHNGMRTPDMGDISLRGTDYKLFTFPFLLGQHRMVLCGLMKTEVYNTNLHTIPVGTSYTLVICLVLFLLSLPFLKIFMMNVNDRIYAFNLAIGIVFLFLMASFITIISTQLVALNQGRMQIRANLDSLTVKLEDSLIAELTDAQQEMIYFDDRLAHYVDSTKKDTLSYDNSPWFLISVDPKNTNTAFNRKPRVLSGHIPVYHDADNISWGDDNGKEMVRLRYIDTATAMRIWNFEDLDTVPFVDIHARPYYQEMSARSKYKRDSDSTLMLAPVQSWASGEFRVNLVRFSQKQTGMLLQVMATRLYSLVNTVLPAGYGFCVFDVSGKTLIHSDTLKSLRENFLDETGRLPWILGSVRGRQGIQSGSVDFYGENYSLRIQPLKQHPLFLAVFYDNDFLGPVNLRILSFSLFFCLLNYVLLYLFFLFLYRIERRSPLYSPMDYYWRIVPSRNKFDLYFSGSFVLLAYILFFSLLACFSPAIGYDVDYTVLVLGILTPFIGLYSLWLLQRYLGSLESNRARKYALPVLVAGAVIFAISLFVQWPLEPFSYSAMIIGIYFMLYNIACVKGKRWNKFWTRVRSGTIRLTGWNHKTVEEKKLFSYSMFVTLFIFTIAVMPVLEFSWFAYNHELRQSVKKEQLQIAYGLQNREKGIRSFMRRNQPDFTASDTSRNFRLIQYTKGIYPLYRSSIGSGMNSTDTVPGHHDIDHDSRSEAFYLAMASTFNLIYEDPGGLPPLYDGSVRDNLYHWYVGNDSGELNFSRPKWKIPPRLADQHLPAISLKIVSKLPNGLHLDFRLYLIFGAMLLALMLAIYWLTKSIARQIYLTKITGDAGSGIHDHNTENKNEFWKECFEKDKNNSNLADFLRDLRNEYPSFDKTKDPVKQESAIVAKSQELAPLFQCVWEGLNDREKWLLYCLANDGLINHKNESVIYSLLNKNLIVIYDQRIRLISYSFREFILSRDNTDEEKKLLVKMKSGGSWDFVRFIVVVLIISVFIFLFLTRQEVSTKIIGLLTSLSVVLPLIFKLGSSTTPAGADKK